MPIVRATIGPKFPESNIRDLMSICKEIVPAAINSDMGPLSPGCIEFVPQRVDYGIQTDIFLDIEAYTFADRLANREDRAEIIRKALKSFMPKSTFMIWLKFVEAGFASDIEDNNLDCDMSMEAAINRAKHIISTTV